MLLYSPYKAFLGSHNAQSHHQVTLQAFQLHTFQVDIVLEQQAITVAMEDN